MMSTTYFLKRFIKLMQQKAGVPLIKNFLKSMYRSFKLTITPYENFVPSKKFAFLVHEPMMFVHYDSVWKALGAEIFTIVTTKQCFIDSEGNKKLGTDKFMESVRENGYEILDVETVLKSGKKFEYSVSNHIISGTTSLEGFGNDTYLPCLLGTKRIRFMYGADLSDGWSLQPWNEIYDYFLCHGVNDERELKKRFKGKTFVMGYPRYDRFFSEEIDLSSIANEFRTDQHKKTILWMPTLGGEYSSIPLYAESLSTLQNKFNIIVRPHPISFVTEPEYISLLEGQKFHIDANPLRDMNELFKIADVILVDNGGTPFSAIFLGKNIIFLDVPEEIVGDSSFTNYFKESSVMELKKHLPVLKPDQMQSLIDMVESKDFYKENKDIIDLLFNKYFDSPRGGGAIRVAEIFSRLP